MEKYPFVFLNHGSLDIEYVDKCEELFIWFGREITVLERELIMKNCPKPVDCIYHWGKEFIYFGSNGDTYDFDLVMTYGDKDNEKFRKFFQYNEKNYDEDDDNDDNDDKEEYDDNDEYDGDDEGFYDAFDNLLTDVLPLFQKDIEDWIKGVNDMVPVTVFSGPGCLEIDGWGEWSGKTVYKTVMPSFKSYKIKYKEILSEENDEMKYLGFIYDIIADYSWDDDTGGLTVTELLSDMEFAYDMDGLNESLDRLHYSDHKLQRNANRISGILSGLSCEKKVEKINSMKPYMKFAYYASYASCRENDLLINGAPVEFLKDIIKNLPEERKPVIGTFLRFIALNLVHIAPGFDDKEKNDRTHARLAAQIMELALSYEDDENGYIYCATFYDWLKDYEAMLVISLKAVEKYPNNNSIIANVIYAAGNCGKPELAEEYVTKKIDDPLIIANQSFAFVKSGRLQEAYDLLVGHFNNGGKFNAYSFNNLLYVCNYYKKPEKEILDDIIAKAEKKFFMDAEYSNAEFVNSLVILLGNIEPERAVKVFLSFMKDGGDTSCSLWCNYTYAASKTIDLKLIKISIDDFQDEFTKDPGKFKNDTANYWLILANIACEYAQLGDKANMLEYLKRMKGIHPDFKSLKKDNDFKDYWNDPDFLKLFK